jgi:uncharacterized protein YeaO (DUF488 family)
VEIEIKRAYEKAQKSDGYRVLVDRVWPRGKSKEELELDEWLRDVAPSAKLRKWYCHDPAKFAEFKKEYKAELAKSGLPNELLLRAKGKKLTLVYGAKDTEHNQAVVLREYLKSLK